MNNARRHRLREQGYSEWAFYTPEGYLRQLARSRAWGKLKYLTDPRWVEKKREADRDRYWRYKSIYGGDPNRLDSANIKFTDHKFEKRIDKWLAAIKARIYYGTVTKEFGERRIRELEGQRRYPLILT